MRAFFIPILMLTTSCQSLSYDRLRDRPSANVYYQDSITKRACPHCDSPEYKRIVNANIAKEKARNEAIVRALLSPKIIIIKDD